MLMVIFGAGASYDSVDMRHAHRLRGFVTSSVRHRPPLASELFDERELATQALAAYPQVLPLVPRMREAGQAGGGAVEATLRAFQLEAASYTQRAQQVAAVGYYLKRLLLATTGGWLDDSHRITNYVTLVDRLGYWQARTKEPICYVTFNYDCLLEDALAASLGWPDWNRWSIDTYISDPAVSVIKPHGSADWVQVARAPSTTNAAYSSEADLIKHAGEWQTVDRFAIDGNLPFKIDQLTYTVPAVALPVDQSKTFVLPSAHLALLQRAIPQIDRLLVVGWRAQEDHFTNLMGAMNKPRVRVCVVDWDKAADDVVLRLRKAVATANVHPVVGTGFTEFLRGDALEMFLQLP